MGVPLPTFPTVFSATPSAKFRFEHSLPPTGGLGRRSWSPKSNAHVPQEMGPVRVWGRLAREGGRGGEGLSGEAAERRERRWGGWGPPPPAAPTPPPSRTGPRPPRPLSPSAEAGRSPQTRCHRPWRSLMVERRGEVWAPDPSRPPAPLPEPGVSEQPPGWMHWREG